ncbi:MAG: RNA polymerase sigma factor [Acidobacteria bacterium]|nr:RNA polymerase sigma factor [Acidobacteriota bacterium]MCB9378437.1 RNA polymerase sigma factor [Holophagales bacterium]
MPPLHPLGALDLPAPSALNESDGGLLARAAAGDRKAFDAFVERHQSALYRFALALGATPEEGEDLIQETFLAAWRGASGFRSEGSARSWLFTTARRRYWRHRSRREVDLRPLAELGEEAGWGVSGLAQQLAPRWEDRLTLAAVFESLTDSDREVLVLVDLEGFSLTEAATNLEISLPALKSRLHRARLHLAAALRGGRR